MTPRRLALLVRLTAGPAGLIFRSRQPGMLHCVVRTFVAAPKVMSGVSRRNTLRRKRPLNPEINLLDLQGDIGEDDMNLWYCPAGLGALTALLRLSIE